jgi:hypothetical protein
LPFVSGLYADSGRKEYAKGEQQHVFEKIQRFSRHMDEAKMKDSGETQDILCTGHTLRAALLYFYKQKMLIPFIATD